MTARLQIGFETEHMTAKQMARAELSLEAAAGAVSSSGGWKGTVRLINFDQWGQDAARKVGERVSAEHKQLKLTIRVSLEGKRTEEFDHQWA